MASADVYDDSKEIRFVLIGKTGSGKSSLGNTILGRKEFISKFSSQSVTHRTSCKEVTYGPKKIRILDTPGLFDTGDLDKKKADWLTNEILKSTILSVPGPHAFLFVVQIGTLTPEDVKTTLKIFDLFGKKVYKYIIIIFTHVHKLKDENMEFDEYKASFKPFYSELLQLCDNRVLYVDNKRGSEQEKKEFVENLLMVVHQMKKNGYYSNKTIEDATRLFFKKVDDVQKKEVVSYEEAVQMVLTDIEREGTIFQYLKSGSFGLAIGAVVAGLLAVFTPAGLFVAAGVGGASGTFSAGAMLKEKCCVM